MRRTALAIVLALLVGLGIGLLWHNRTVAPASPSSSPVATATPVASPVANASATTAPVAPAITACKSSGLKVAIANSQGAAGSTYFDLVFTNTSTSSCTLYGYPGLSFIDGSGNQLGAAATRNTTVAPNTVTLAPSVAAHTVVQLGNAGNYDPGTCSAAATSLKVFPPGETAALIVPSTQQACPNFQVQAIVPGASS